MVEVSALAERGITTRLGSSRRQPHDRPEEAFAGARQR